MLKLLNDFSAFLLSGICGVSSFCLLSLSHSVSRCVFTFATDEKLLQTKSEGSDVSTATDQLTEDRHGRKLGFVFRYISWAGGHVWKIRAIVVRATHRLTKHTVRTSETEAVASVTDNKQLADYLFLPHGGLQMIYLKVFLYINNLCH